MQIPFCGPTYQNRISAVDSSRCINLIPEVNSSDQHTPVTLVGAPGFKLACSPGAPVFGLHTIKGGGSEVLVMVLTDGTIYIAIGSADNFPVYGPYGTVSTAGTTTPLKMVDNGTVVGLSGGNSVFFVAGAYGYNFNYITYTLTRSDAFTGGGFPTVSQSNSFCAYIDGYFILINGSLNAYSSNLFDGTVWNALATTPVTSESDPIRNVVSVQEQLYFIKQTTTEIWVNNSTPTSSGFPFSRASGAVLDYGTVSAQSVAKVGSSIMFLASQKNAQGDGHFVGVAMLQGYSVQIVSTPQIAYMLENMGPSINSFSGYKAFAYSEAGHTFYVLQSSTLVLVYDLVTSMWHERLPVDFQYYVGMCTYYNRNIVAVADPSLGSSYWLAMMSQTVFTNGGAVMTATRTSQFIKDAADHQNVFLSRVEIEMGPSNASGSANTAENTATFAYNVVGGQLISVTPVTIGADYNGLNPPTLTLVDFLGTGSGAVLTPVISNGSITFVIVTNPGANYSANTTITITPHGVRGYAPTLQWSDDGGQTWSSQYSLSQSGDGRLILRRLGRFRSRAFRLTLYDTSNKSVLAVTAEVGK